MERICLAVEQAAFRYEPGRLLFHDITFQLHRGETLTVLGPNGAGKSTLLDCVGGLKKLLSGRVIVGGTDIERCTRRQLARKIGYVPQIHSHTCDFSVREYVAMGRAPYIGIWSNPTEKDYRLVDAALERLELTHLRDKSYTCLSGGECQQVMIARAIVQQSEVILMDEPTNHLDYGNQLKVLRQIKRLTENGYSIIWTTHMPDHALMLGGRVAILDREGCWETGDAEALITEERMTGLYGTRICRTHVEKADREACLPYRL